MSQTLEVVKQLESRTFRLILKLESLEQDLIKAEAEKLNLKQQIKTLNSQGNSLATENEQLKTANAILGSKDYKRETKLKINRLIKEVDKCIIQLSE